MSPTPPVHVLQQAGLADRIDDAVRRVLDNPPYRDEPNLPERLAQWVVDRLGGVFGSGSVGWVARVLEGIVWVGIATTLVVVAWLVVRRIGAGAFTWRAHRDAITTTTVEVPDRSVADWLALARTASEQGRHRDAVRAAYRAVVGHLVTQQAVPAMAGATVGAHREALRHSHVVVELQALGFDRASDVFERVWYADLAAGPDDVDVVLAAADALGVGG